MFSLSMRARAPDSAERVYSCCKQLWLVEDAARGFSLLQGRLNGDALSAFSAKGECTLATGRPNLGPAMKNLPGVTS